jgi:glycerol uptake facilitator-like aquaporin
MIVLPYLAELLGTFLLVLSVFASGGNAFIVGGTLTLIILLAGKVSGSHLNPVISFAMLLEGSMSTIEFVTYLATQMAGSTAAYYTYKIIM